MFYEYFIERDQSAISELGAYFIDRHIVNYIYKKLDPIINEENSIDMFGGSSSFTTGYINYLNNNINKIYHFDINSPYGGDAQLKNKK